MMDELLVISAALGFMCGENPVVLGVAISAYKVGGVVVYAKLRQYLVVDWGCVCCSCCSPRKELSFFPFPMFPVDDCRLICF